MSTSTFVQQLYTTLLGRSPDSAGLAYWTALIDGGKASAPAVAEQFLQSKEFADAVQPVARLYMAAFGRIPDEAGLSFWTKAAQAGAPLSLLAQQFAGSTEFKNLFGGMTDDAFVDALYSLALQHKPDQALRTQLLQGLASGALARADVLTGLAGSAEMVAAKSEAVKVIALYHGTVGVAPTQQQIDAALHAHDPLALVTSLLGSADYHGVAVPSLPSALPILTASHGSAGIAPDFPPTLTSWGTNSSNVVTLTFSEQIVSGSGMITITDGATQTIVDSSGHVGSRIIDATDTRYLSMTDGQVSINGNTLTITLTTPLTANKQYAVTMTSGAVHDTTGNAFAGIADTTQTKIATMGDSSPPYVLSLSLDQPSLDSVTHPSATMTLQLSEAVPSLSLGAFNVPNGTLSNLATTDHITWTATFTPAALTKASGNQITFATYAIQDAAGNHGVGTYLSPTYDIDTLPRISSFSMIDTGAYNNDFITNQVHQTISGTYTGTLPAGATIQVDVNGSAGAATTDGQGHWTFATDLPAGASLVTMYYQASDGVTQGAQAKFAPTLDNTAPTVTYSSSQAPLTAIALTFNEAMALGSSGSVSITGGSAPISVPVANLTLSGDQKTVYLPASIGLAETTNYVMTLPSSVTDIAGNAYAGGNLNFTTTSDGFPHALSATILTSSTGKFHAGQDVEIDIAFDENVLADGTTPPTLGLTIGSNSRSATYSSGSGTNVLKFIYTVQPQDTDNLIHMADVSGLLGGSIKDVDGNALVSSHIMWTSVVNDNMETIDNSAPLANGLSISQPTVSSNGSATVTLSFNEAIQPNTVSLSDFTAPHGTLSNLAIIDSKTMQATFTPDANTEQANLQLSFDARNVLDLAGNASTSTITSGLYKVDTVAPTLDSISMSPTTLTSGANTATVTMVFSEPIASAPSTLQFVDGSINTPVTSDGGTTWTVTFTANPNTSSTSETIFLDTTAVHDLAGNVAATSTTHLPFTIDTLAPQPMSINLGNTDLHAGQTTTVTVTFSEKIKTLDPAWFNVGSATLGAFTTTDSGLTWTATLTPSAATFQGTNTISLAGSHVADLNNNTGTGTATSTNYSVDTVATGSVTSVTLGSDNGASSTDLITNYASQSVLGTYSGLSADDKVQIKIGSSGAYNDANMYDASHWMTSANFTASDTITTRVAHPVYDGTHTSVLYTSYSAETTYNVQIDTTAPVATTPATVWAEDGVGFTIDEAMYYADGSATATLTNGQTTQHVPLNELFSSGSGVMEGFLPSVWLTGGQSYTLSFPSGLTDIAGNHLADQTFTTNPSLEALSASYTATGTKHVGDTVDITVTFNQPATATGSSLELETGTTHEYATYLSSSGNTVTYEYTVQAGDYASALDVAADFQPGFAAQVLDAAGHALQSAHIDFSTLGHSGYGVLVDTTPATAPTIDGLCTDGGVSSSDNVSASSSIHGSGAPASGAHVLIFEGSQQIGDAYADSSGNWTSNLDVTEGAHTVTAKVMSAGGDLASAASTSYAFTYDASSPMVVGHSQASATDPLVLTFNEPIYGAVGAWDIQDSNNTSVGGTVTATLSGDGLTVTLAHSASLGPGTYRVVTPGTMTDAAGNLIPGNIAFGTSDTTAPTLSSPSSGNTSSGTAILNFSEAVDLQAGGHFYIYDGSTLIQTISYGSMSTDGTGVYLSLAVNSGLYNTGHTYSVTMAPDTVIDTSGNVFVGLTGTSDYTFTLLAA
ncbi:MAG: Ig-like domain-containing protein [Telluria sp.]